MRMGIVLRSLKTKFKTQLPLNVARKLSESVEIVSIEKNNNIKVRAGRHVLLIEITDYN